MHKYLHNDQGSGLALIAYFRVTIFEINIIAIIL